MTETCWRTHMLCVCVCVCVCECASSFCTFHLQIYVFYIMTASCVGDSTPLRRLLNYNQPNGQTPTSDELAVLEAGFIWEHDLHFCFVAVSLRDIRLAWLQRWGPTVSEIDREDSGDLERIRQKLKAETNDTIWIHADVSMLDTRLNLQSELKWTESKIDREDSGDLEWSQNPTILFEYMQILNGD